VELRPFVREGDRLDFSWNTNVALGGPIRQNKIWYFGAFRLSQTDSFVANMYFPDGRPVNRGGAVAPHATVRLTSQLSQRNKIVFAYYWSRGKTQRFDVGCSAQAGNVVACTFPEASYSLPTPLQYAAQVKWMSPATNRLLLENQERGPGDHFFAVAAALSVARAPMRMPARP
jgi:hypothetical protein